MSNIKINNTGEPSTQLDIAGDWYKVIVQSVPEGFLLIKHPEGNIVDTNDIFCDMTGYSRDKLLSMKIDNIDVEFMDAPKKLSERLLNAKENGKPAFETSYKRKDGKIIYVAVDFKYIEIASSGLNLCFCRDITRQKMIETMLSDAMNKYQVMFEEAPVALWEVDYTDVKKNIDDLRSKGGKDFNSFLEKNLDPPFQVSDRPRIARFNKSQLELWELESVETKEDFNKEFYNFFYSYQDNCKAAKDDMMRLASGQTSFTKEDFIRTSKGNRKFIHTKFVIAPGHENTWSRLFVSLTDITERKKAEDEIIEAREKLRELTARLQTIRENEREQISRRIHDEVGQLLTALKMDLIWLARKIPERQKPLASKVDSMIKTLDSTSQVIRGVSAALRPRLLDELGLTAAVDWQAREFQKASGIKCDFISNPEQIIGGKDSNTGFFRILQELLTNVFLHAEASRVCIRLEEKDGQLKLKLNDNGKGISKEQFFAPNSLGLLGIQERAHSMGGSFYIKGSKNKGTTAIISVPLGTLKKTNDENNNS